MPTQSALFIACSASASPTGVTGFLTDARPPDQTMVAIAVRSSCDARSRPKVLTPKLNTSRPKHRAPTRPRVVTRGAGEP